MRNFSYMTEQNICSVKYFNTSHVKNSLQIYKTKKKKNEKRL